MRRARFWNVVALFLLAGCASGGGGSSGVPTSGSQSSGGTPVPPSFVIGAPAEPPLLGNKPAATGAATVTGGTPPAGGTSFGLDQTIYSVSSTGLIGYNGSINQASLTYTGSAYQLSIPNDGVTLNVTSAQTSGTSSNGSPVAIDLTEWSYVLGGFWYYGSTGNLTLSTFESGYLAPQSAIPVLGTATYTSTGGVVGVVHSIVNGSYEPVPVVGDASLTANFGTSQITGLFTNMVATNSANQSFPWNNISLTAAITGNGGGNYFHGTTQVTNVPGNAYALQSNGTGYVDGEFYGPQATEIGALWNASDGKFAATGVVEADGTPPPGSAAVSVPVAAGDFLNPNALFDVTSTSNPFAVAIPAAASTGNSPSPPVLASSGGPSFSGNVFSGNPPVPGTAFPLTQSVMQVSPSGASVDSNTISGGATFIIEPYNIGPGSNVQLDIPSLGISEKMPILQTTSGITGALNGTGVAAPNAAGQVIMDFTGLNYTVFGAWSGPTGSNQPDVAGFVFGYQTPTNGMPTSGTASYAGKGTVNGFVFVQGQPAGNPVALNGDASFNVDFAAGQVSGAFTNMAAYARNPNNINSPTLYAYPWNNVSVSASIASGQSTFSGGTTATSQPNTPYALQSSATGHINGGFYGPAADELGAVWTLSNGNGTGSAIGAVGATKQ